MDIKRKSAAALLESISLLAAKEIHGPAPVPAEWAYKLQKLFEDAGLEIYEPCNGEAHSNPHIDNCGVCMRSGHWGWVGGSVKVK